MRESSQMANALQRPAAMPTWLFPVSAVLHTAPCSEHGIEEKRAQRRSGQPQLPQSKGQVSDGLAYPPPRNRPIETAPLPATRQGTRPAAPTGDPREPEPTLPGSASSRRNRPDLQSQERFPRFFPNPVPAPFMSVTTGPAGLSRSSLSKMTHISKRRLPACPYNAPSRFATMGRRKLSGLFGARAPAMC